MSVTVPYRDQAATLKLIVVAGEGPSLLGRDWLRVIRLDWQSLKMIRMTGSGSLIEILKKHKCILKKELGFVKDAPVKIHVDEAQLRFYKARTLQYATVA